MTDQTVWARGLNDQQLANGLRNATEFVNGNAATKFQAILNEAAQRIEPTAEDNVNPTPTVLRQVADLMDSHPELDFVEALTALDREDYGLPADKGASINLADDDRWVVKPWSADGSHTTEDEADGWFVQDSRLGYATDPFRTRRAAEADAALRNAANARHQVLVTLPNGAQVFLSTTDPDPQVMYRTSQGGSWTLPLYPSKRPHEKNTIYVGEW